MEDLRGDTGRYSRIRKMKGNLLMGYLMNLCFDFGVFLSVWCCLP